MIDIAVIIVVVLITLTTLGALVMIHFTLGDGEGYGHDDD